MNKLESILSVLLILNGLSCFALSLAYMIKMDNPSKWFGCFLLFVVGAICLKLSRSVKYEQNS